MTWRYDWSLAKTLDGRERQAIPHYIDPDEEPTVRIPVERARDIMERTPAELDAELRQHAEAGR